MCRPGMAPCQVWNTLRGNMLAQQVVCPSRLVAARELDPRGPVRIASLRAVPQTYCPADALEGPLRASWQDVLLPLWLGRLRWGVKHLEP
jgi:hypothetical protein